ncbi:MAG: iron-containing alcohol dehydrogenase [Anaeroplasmataceae bacterium]
MNNFIYDIPTKIYFGKNEENNTGKIIKEYGFKNILIHYGKNSVIKSGVLNKITQQLDNENIKYHLLGGVEANPKLSLVLEGVKYCKENKIDFVLAIGGGSVIDSAKSICNGVVNNFNPWLLNEKKEVSKGALKIGCILTLSAAGSEMSQSCVITNDETNIKTGFSSIYNRPLFSILNPELTYTVDQFQTGCGIVDILMHTLERYFTTTKNTALTDYLSEGLMKSVIEAGKTSINDLNNYEARETLMWASSLSHNDLLGVGRTLSMPVHQIEHEISGMFDFVAHGAGLSIVFPAWAKYAYKSDLDKFSRFAYNVMKVDTSIDKENAALLGIEKLEKYFKEIKMPTRLSEVKIDESHFEKLALNFSKNKTRIINDIVDIDYYACLKILTLCK